MFGSSEASVGKRVGHVSEAPPSKGTFFCPACDHRSRFDGNWTVLEGDSAIRYLCPDCDTEITRRETPAENLQNPQKTSKTRKKSANINTDDT